MPVIFFATTNRNGLEINDCEFVTSYQSPSFERNFSLVGGDDGATVSAVHISFLLFPSSRPPDDKNSQKKMFSRFIAGSLDHCRHSLHTNESCERMTIPLCLLIARYFWMKEEIYCPIIQFGWRSEVPIRALISSPELVCKTASINECHNNLILDSQRNYQLFFSAHNSIRNISYEARANHKTINCKEPKVVFPYLSWCTYPYRAHTICFLFAACVATHLYASFASMPRFVFAKRETRWLHEVVGIKLHLL